MMLLIFTACQEDSLTPYVSVETTDAPLVISEIISDKEFARLEEEGKPFLICCETRNGEKARLPCRWSDDRDGSKYGTVDCENGTCGGENRREIDQYGNVLVSEQRIICVDGNGTVVSSGAVRPFNP